MTVVDGTDRFLRPTDLKATRRNHRQLQARRILLGLANLLFLAGLVLGGLWLYRRAQEDTRFSLSRFEVSGVNHTPRGEIDAVVHHYGGANLFRMEIDSLRSELLALPWVESVAIEKKLPDTLRVQITERRPVALLLVAGGDLRYVDASGVAFAKLSPKIGNAELPLISSTEPRDLRRTVNFLTKVRLRTPELYSRVSEISAVAPNGFAVFDRDLAARVLLREADYADKWRRLYEIAAAESFARASIHYADLRFANRVVIKPKQEHEPRTGEQVPVANAITN